MPLPPGYGSITEAGATAFALTEAVPWLTGTLREFGSLHDWASAADGREALRGRGTVFSIPAPLHGPDRRERWAVRHYHRGGLIAPLLGDRYLRLGVPRPLRETAASEALRREGIRTPAVVAGAVYRSGATYSADLVTELVPGARTLAGVFTAGGVGTDRGGAEGAMRATGRLVRRLAETGFIHPDFNATNVLIVPGSVGVEAWVLDLDRGRFTAAGARDRHATRLSARMSARLQRSLAKLNPAGGSGSAGGLTLGDAELAAAWAAFHDGLESGA